MTVHLLISSMYFCCVDLSLKQMQWRGLKERKREEINWSLSNHDRILPTLYLSSLLLCQPEKRELPGNTSLNVKCVSLTTALVCQNWVKICSLICAKQYTRLIETTAPLTIFLACWGLINFRIWEYHSRMYVHLILKCSAKFQEVI